MRIIASSLALVLFVGTATVSTAAIYDNPVVPNAQLGEFRHGTYPSIGDRTHVGVDLVSSCGAPVYAYDGGRVIDLIASEADQNFGKLGYMVLIEHEVPEEERPLASLYLHLKTPPLVRKNQKVKAGTKLGEVGDTGFSLGCHLHFEVRHFLSRFHREWKKIYGDGDKRSSEEFREDWEDPEVLLKQQKNEEPAQLSAAPDLDYHPLKVGLTKTFNKTQKGTYHSFDRRKEHSPLHSTVRKRMLESRFLDGKKVFPLQINGFIEYWGKDVNGAGSYGKQSPSDIDPIIYDKPAYFFRYPLVVGNSWESQILPWLLRREDFDLPNIVNHCETLMIDDIVTTPVGTFDKCLRIYCSGEIREERSFFGSFHTLHFLMESYEWYAPNVGFVKGIYKHQLVEYLQRSNIVFEDSYESMTTVLTSSAIQ